MEITVRVVSRLLGTCIVIDRVPVKSEILINDRKEMKMFLAQENVSWEPPAFCFDSTMQTASVKFRKQTHKKKRKKEIFVWLLCLTQFKLSCVCVRLLCVTNDDTETVNVVHLQCSLCFGSRP